MSGVRYVAAAVRVLVTRWSIATGPCARCWAPTDRYGPHGRPLCPACRAPREDHQP